jgi:hypothetical protein
MFLNMKTRANTLLRDPIDSLEAPREAIALIARNRETLNVGTSDPSCRWMTEECPCDFDPSPLQR